ncbi:MAG: hypothetical protein ACI4TM_04855 [Candidatus Cryptobacteroides sp.]
MLNLFIIAITICSCFKIDVPAHYTYELHPSEDLLELFNIDVQYINHKGEENRERITKNDWKCIIYSLDNVPSEGINVKFTAKNTTLNGDIPEKEIYSFQLNPSVSFTHAEKQSIGGTKSSLDSSENETVFRFKVPIGTLAPDNITISICPLKYNKHFAFSYSVDDSYVNGWSRIFALFNGLWIDDQEFFHFGLQPVTGVQNEPLCVTDGCGNDRRFSFGESIQASVWNNNNLNGIIQDVITSKYNPYISWEELQMMTDMGNAVYFHDVDESKWYVDEPEEIVEGLAEDYERTISKIGYPMKTLSQPNASNAYLEAAKKSPLVYMTRVTNNRYTDICFDDNPSLFKAEVFGGNSNASNDDKLAELAAQATNAHPVLISMFSHRPQDAELIFFREVARLYGKNGADNIWVASYDELYDYSFLKNNASIISYVEGDYKVFEIRVSNDNKIVFSELSFLIEGSSGKAVQCSENLYGFSSAQQEDGRVLVNCNFGSKLFDLAVKYVSLYESTRNAYHKNISEYLVSLLRDDLREPLYKRINGVHEPTMLEMPLEGEYRKEQLPDYIRLYNGYSFILKNQ